MNHLLVRKKKWLEMYKAIKNEGIYQLCFYEQGKGYGIMDCDGDNFIFRDMPLGASSDRSIRVIIPLDKYKQKILDAFKLVLENENIVNCWK